MILPIVSYGFPILKKKCSEIDDDFQDLEILLENMWQTMYNAKGVGLAAPQINQAIRVFVVDSSPFHEQDDTIPSLKQVFINPVILEEFGEDVMFNEGCLSIPDIREDICRKSKITIKYFDEQFQSHTKSYEGIPARVIQHEYDHIEGILFTDKLSPIKKRMIKRRLENISKGKVQVDYNMKFWK